METHLAEWLRGTPEGIEAESILRRCVHCGFCTATCPTYQVLGDELDSPRGRIYLIKRVVEGERPGESTMQHLDRCLTCRNCETTCPSGVQYGHLVDIGRKLVEEQVTRPAAQRLIRAVLKETLTRRWLFDPAMRVGQAVRALIPRSLRAKVPEYRDPGRWPRTAHPRKVILLDGCVQPAMVPAIDAATARVLDAVGVQSILAPRSGCCGAIRYHLNDQEGGLDNARRNVDAWWPHIEAGAEAIVVNASGCGVMIKDYGHLLRQDPVYADRASRIAAMTKDLSEYLPPLLERLRPRLGALAGRRVAFHPPCSLQHGQQIRGLVERLLADVGAEVLPVADSHLCCGSAGTYSVLQSALATELRDRKLLRLSTQRPDAILSANIGCITHLQSGTDIPVRHWVEWLDAAIA